MEIELKDNIFFPNLKDILLKKGNRNLKIFYGINGDLYFDMFGNYEKTLYGNVTSFEINKEDQIFPYFERLFEIIKNVEIFTVTDYQLSFCDCTSDVMDMIESVKERNTYLYNELVRGNIIDFYSDSIYNKDVNRMIIENVEDKIILHFLNNPKDCIGGFKIKINNASSKYMPFNICFMNFFNKLHNDLTAVQEENIQKKIGTI